MTMIKMLGCLGLGIVALGMWGMMVVHGTPDGWTWQHTPAPVIIAALALVFLASTLMRGRKP